MRPSIQGAPKPARLAMELISATPPAAAVPARKRLGICQNTGMALMVPTMDSVSPTSTASALCPRKSATASSDTAPSAAARPQCQRDSWCLSE